jgi:hypothetical protein
MLRLVHIFSSGSVFGLKSLTGRVVQKMPRDGTYTKMHSLSRKFGAEFGQRKV